jgi:hypothetical protein
MKTHETREESIADVTREQRYDTFDKLIDQYEAGEFGEPGTEAWALAIETWGRRTKVALEAGVTALSANYEVHKAVMTAEAEDFDAQVAAGREDRLVAELLAGIEIYEGAE